MRTATISEVTASIDAHAERTPGGAIATDGDGTLWSGDIGEDLFHALLASKRLLAAVHEPLVREAEAERIDASGSSSDVAERIYAAYLGGTFPEERVCEIMAWVFAGWTDAEMSAFAADAVRAVGLRDRLHREALAIVEHARSRSIPVYLVSASPRAVVLEAARLVGIDPACVHAATPCSSGGVVAAEVQRPIPYGPGKVKHLRAELGARPLYAAMGDNAFDVALLVESKTPIAIRPKPRLVARAAEVPGLVVLAPLGA